MSITIEEATRIARAYKLSLTDAETLIRLVGPDGTPEDAVHIAVDLAGSNEERNRQTYADEHKKQEADKAAEHKAAAAYQAANPKPKKPKREPVVPDLRDGMSDNDRVRAINEAHAKNVKAAADERYDEAQQQAKDYYNWTQSDDYHNFKASLRHPEQGGD